ncbi:MAG TPA: bifunctional ornithine acetyltransferase/N-acetylglutamate synthase, partial [Syntrophales bacterium]|nr:bifunctional ornithine acetyltransferase/N-acetylglutamate synthase [Syntrophales bacterium]
VGTVNEHIPVDAVRVSFDQVPIFEDGRSVTGFESELKEIMASPRIRVRIRMGMGKKGFRLLSSDLSHEYVTINAHYHT